MKRAKQRLTLKPIPLERRFWWAIIRKHSFWARVGSRPPV